MKNNNISQSPAASIRKSYLMSGGVKLLLSAFWIVAIIFPLIKMLSNMGSIDTLAMISEKRFQTALVQSLIVAIVSTLISVSRAGLMAWCTTRTAIKFKSGFSVIFTVPMLIPSISHGMGLIILFGSNGIINNMFGTDISVYGFWGIVIGSVMYSFPVAYLLLYDVLRFEDSTPYEAADVLGLSKLNRLFAITLPYLRKPLISVFFATFTMIITDYGVPLMIGGKYTTLPVMMYQDVIGMLDFGRGSVIGMVLLIPALIACLIDMFNRDKGNTAFVARPFKIRPRHSRDITAYVICILVSALVVLPIAVFACVAFVRKYPIDMSLTTANIEQALRMNAGTYLINSVIISVFVCIIGVVLATVCAYFTARMPSKFSKMLHLLSITSLAIPGLVLGLSYVMFFKKSFIYGTFAMLILVNTMHFFSSPYLMMYNTFNKLNANLESVGKTLGISRMRMIKDVIIPLSSGTLVEMASYFFVNSMMTISAVSFLATQANKPVSLMITQFEGQMQLECAAFVSLLILVINVILKIAAFVIKKKLTKR